MPDQTRIKVQNLVRSLKLGVEGLFAFEKKKAKEEKILSMAFDSIVSYENLASEVYRLRAQAKDEHSDILRVASDTLASTAHELVGFVSMESGETSGYRLFVNDYRRIWRKHFGLFVFSACFFVATCFLGWNIGVEQPEYLSLFVSQDMMEMVLDQTAWFERLQSNPILYGVQIALNNIKVSILAFVTGAILGLGGVYILTWNGLMFGALLGFCWTQGFDEPLLTFVATHGPLELTIIVASCFSSFLVGRVFYLRPYSLFRVRLQEAAKEAFTLFMGVLPWLILAAILEAGMSPWPGIPVELKIFTGTSVAFFFWLWTFWPFHKKTLS